MRFWEDRTGKKIRVKNKEQLNTGIKLEKCGNVEKKFSKSRRWIVLFRFKCYVLEAVCLALSSFCEHASEMYCTGCQKYRIDDHKLIHVM